jgi:uncharacterized membrane protein YeiH
VRDVVIREIPAQMRPGQYASLALLAACGLYLLLTLHLGCTPTLAAWLTVGAFFLARVLTIRFNWRTRSVWEGS